jgi:4-hydroxythreonine-4-phosphate dehydrogenase
MKPIILTSGDPAGIGPEVALKAARLWGQRREARPLLLAGDATWLRKNHPEAFNPTDSLQIIDTSWDFNPDLIGSVGKAQGKISFDSIRTAVELCMSGKAAAMVTAPIHKESLSQAGVPWPGHTEMLAALASPSSPPEVRMMLINPDLRVVLNTVHLALQDVPRALTQSGLLTTIELAHRACQELGLALPRIAVAGLNPHAGESGLFGREEIDVIAPAIQSARMAGINVTGPWPGDTVFMKAKGHKDFDVVIAQYHDQGLIPIKYLGLDQGVNVTIGLPFIRTSVDHGTAFDLAGKNAADPGSMLAAIELADRLARLRGL